MIEFIRKLINQKKIIEEQERKILHLTLAKDKAFERLYRYECGEQHKTIDMLEKRIKYLTCQNDNFAEKLMARTYLSPCEVSKQRLEHIAFNEDANKKLKEKCERLQHDNDMVYREMYQLKLKIANMRIDEVSNT